MAGDTKSDRKFCAFLRGVNVKGTNMKMADVCSVFERTGMKEVSSVLASGNILFSTEVNAEELKEILEKAMSEHFSYDAFLFVKTQKEIESIFHENPFAMDSAYHIYGFVGVDGIAQILMSEFEKSEKTCGEEAQINGQNFYWKVPKGNTLDSQFGNILGRKNLKASFTSRNLNTFEKVLKKI